MAPDLSPAQERLAAMAAAISHYLETRQTVTLNMAGLDEANRRIVDEVMGDGEVSIAVAPPFGDRMQESVMPGLWRVQTPAAEHGVAAADTVDIGDVPNRVRAVLAETTRPVLKGPAVLPAGVMNVRPLLTEIADWVARVDGGSPGHAINFSNLPVNADDLTVLGDVLGSGTVNALSRGYSRTRIESTGCRHVWWVRYFNSDDKLLLNTLEITEMPQALLATPDDLADSAERLARQIQVYA